MVNLALGLFDFCSLTELLAALERVVKVGNCHMLYLKYQRCSNPILFVAPTAHGKVKDAWVLLCPSFDDVLILSSQQTPSALPLDINRKRVEICMQRLGCPLCSAAFEVTLLPINFLQPCQDHAYNIKPAPNSSPDTLNGKVS